MGFEEGTESAESFDGNIEATEATGPDTTGGFNPAWEPIKEKLGDAAFQLIQPELNKWDQGVNKRFETISSEYAPYKDLGTPEELTNYRAIVQQMDENPEAMYEALGNFLQENGRMPTKAEAQDIADEIESDESSSDSVDPRYAELAKGQEAIMEFLEKQQEYELQMEAESELDAEIKDLVNSKGYSEADMQEILRTAAFLSSQNDQFVPLAQAAEQFDSLRERILTTPRPGDSAPRLLPTSGGTPQGVQRTVGEMSRNETQDLIAAYLSQGKA
jgi:hypothetical protein